jgi:ribose transport system ATP-binding protein
VVLTAARSSTRFERDNITTGDNVVTSTESVLRLSATGLSKRYGHIKAIQDVSFELRPGEVMALLGENGAGKSTFVKVLSGLVRPDEGEIRIDGRTVDLGSTDKSQQCGVAVVQQEISVVDNMTVAENLLLGQLNAPILWTHGALDRYSRPLLARVGLDDLDPATRVEKLRLADKQLVEVARVLARDARIVIFDEPTAALSDTEIERVLALVRTLASQGRSIIYVTHRLNEVFRIADRVTIFRNGRSQAPLDVASLDVGRIVSMMIGRDLETMYPHAGTPARVTLDVKSLQVPGLSRPVSLQARAGEIVGLAGQLGSGAALTIQALAGVVPGTVGQVAVNGKPVSLDGRAVGLDAGIGYCSSDRKFNGIFAGLQVTANLSAPWLRSVCRSGVISHRQENAKALEVARTIALDPGRLRSTAGKLSGGNQQKVALGKWLGSNPSVLLVEEPTRGVDVGARAEIYARLRALCDMGMAVVVSSSDTAELLGLSDTIASFYRGRLKTAKPRSEWSEEELLQSICSEEAPTGVAA